MVHSLSGLPGVRPVDTADMLNTLLTGSGTIEYCRSGLISHVPFGTFLGIGSAKF